MSVYQLSDVYNESNIPILTFVKPKEFDELVGSIKTKGKHITLSGPSGCGKTTLAKKALEKAGYGPGSTHWMSGRDHPQIDTMIDLFATEFSCAKDKDEIVENLQMAGLIIIDDFHHLPSHIRSDIGYNLKRWHELGIRVFIIGIASSNKKMLEIDSELGIRNDLYEMKRQDDSFIKSVIEAGEQHLNIFFSDDTKIGFVQAAQGIPSAIQIICRVACIRNNISETQSEKKTVCLTMEDIKDGVLRIYRGKYQNKLIGLCKGKQQAKSVHNTYFEIIKNICLIGKSEIQISDLQNRIVRIIDDQAERSKKNTSFHNCLKYLPEVIDERGLGDSIYYDKNSNSISIEDPSFGLYLTLVNIDEIGHTLKVRRTKYPWDVAVSFAGEDRKIVEEFKTILNQYGYTVFYDFDIQHQLWGVNLRQKLSDVYANEAQYMVVFLSENYPEKDWTNFELEIGKEARGKRTEVYLLPVIIDKVDVVGLSKDVSYMDLRRYNVCDVAKTMIQKLEEPSLPM